MALERVIEAESGAPNSEFVKWEIVGGIPTGGCGTETSCTVGSAGKDAEVKAIFKCTVAVCPPPKPKFKLTVTKSGTGTGTVTSSPAGINCGVDCDEEYDEGTVVTLSKAADAGSEFKEWTGACSGSGACEVTMSEAKSVNAKFDLETFALTLNPPIGSGTLSAECDYGSGPEACASLTEIPYNTGVEVTADPAPLNSVASLTGSNSASGCSIAGVGPEEAATCEFDITANSEVTAEFVAAESVESHPANVHGLVPQTTTLEFTEDGEGNTCADVDLGTFWPNLQLDETYAKQCGLIVTASGEENVLSAADGTEGAPHRGHLKNDGGPGPTTYWLAQPLETQAEGEAGLEFPGTGGGTLQPLTSPFVTLLTYGGPVNSDHVSLEFSQLIKEHDALHTGEYSKQITLTLEQTQL